MTAAASSTDLTLPQVLCATGFHAVFLQAALSAPRVHGGTEDSAIFSRLFQLLESVRFDKTTSSVTNGMQTLLAGGGGNCGDEAAAVRLVSEQLAAQWCSSEEDVPSLLRWQRRLQIAAALECVSYGLFLPVKKCTTEDDWPSLRRVLHRMATTSPGQSSCPVSFLNVASSLYEEQLSAERHSNTLFPAPVVLRWQPPQPSSAGVKRSRQEEESTAEEQQHLVYLEAQLYSALAFATCFTTVTPLAKLLVVYLLQSSPAQASSYRRARMHGVVAGLLHIACECARHAQARATQSLAKCYKQQSHHVTSTVAEDQLYPLPEETPIAIVNVALLLHTLVKECSCYEAADQPSSPTTVASVELAEIVMESLQALLTAVIVGGSTRHLSAPEQQPQESNAQQWAGEVFTCRGLAQAEADALVDVILPVFLQSIGFEWFWSESLRYLRRVEKLPLPAAAQPSSDGVIGVKWRSQHVFDRLLLGCADRTYPSRLYSVLPGSFHTLMQSLGILYSSSGSPDGEHFDDGEAMDADEDVQGPEPLFTVPPYYEAPVTAIMSYWQKVGSTQAIVLDELQQVLHHATSVLPMVVQMKAMAPADEDGSEEADENSRARGGGGLFTSNCVKGLLARYEAEALVCAIVTYTQLSVPSHSQELFLQVLPLLDRRISDFHAGGGAFNDSTQLPLFSTTTTQHSDSVGSSVPASFSWRFTPQFERLAGGAGYQFYPQEWLPHVAHLYLHSITHAGEPLMLSSLQGNAAPYSVFAAVAHQLHVTLRDGNSGAAAVSRLSQLSCAVSVLTPPFVSSSESVLASLEPTPGFSGASVSALTQYRRVERFHTFMTSVHLEPTQLHSVLHAVDFGLVACQALLPSTTGFSADYRRMVATHGGAKKVKSAAASFSLVLLQAALRWCREVIGGAPQEAQLFSLHEQLRSTGGHSGGKDLNSPLYPYLFNSLTMDCEHALRRMLRAPSFHLLSSARALSAQQQQNQEENGFTSSLETAMKLLMLEYQHWRHFLEMLFTSSHSHQPARRSDQDWLWASPYFRVEMEVGVDAEATG